MGLLAYRRLVVSCLCNLLHREWYDSKFAINNKVDKIPNFKTQISNKSQNPMNQIQNMYESLIFRIWILFVFCHLMLGIFSIKGFKSVNRKQWIFLSY
jgi:hypothetical protein